MMADLLRARIQEDIKDAMRNQASFKLVTLRTLMADIKKTDIEKRVDAQADRESAIANDSEILAVISRMIKQRLDSLDQYQKANRQDLAKKEEDEIAILRGYLPQQLSEAEIADLVQLAITETKAQAASDMAKVMAFIKPKAQGRADMGKISALVKAKLQ
jgi:uncharacterized protein YqeY